MKGNPVSETSISKQKDTADVKTKLKVAVIQNIGQYR